MSFTNRPLTPREIPPQFLTEYHKCYNTFNKSKNLSFRDKIQKSFAHPKYINFNNNRPHSYRTFLKSSSPFNYYNSGRDNLLVCYNGGPRKEFQPLVTPKYIKNRNSFSLKYKRPCGCYSNYNVSKYSQCFEPYYNYNTSYQEKELPMIDRERERDYNARYSYEKYMDKFNTPKIKNRNGKISYKLKENIEDFKREEREEEAKNAELNHEGNMDIRDKVENEKINQEKSKNDDFRKKYCLNLKPRRRFHKTQIFNKYKPFLVDDFKDYGEYE